MGQIADLVDKQLQDGVLYGVGSMAQVAPLAGWLATITQALYGKSPEHINQNIIDGWSRKLHYIMSGLDKQSRTMYGINEGGFLIRLVERLTRRIQRRWYIDAYGKYRTGSVVSRIRPTEADAAKYARPRLPASLPVTPVPVSLGLHQSATENR